MPNTTLTNPHRHELREETFRAYEHILRDFLAVYPSPFRCVPEKGALTSLVVRLRTAANAVLANYDKFLTPLNDFDLDSFRLAWSKVHVSIVADEVVIATPEAKGIVIRAKVSDASIPKPMFTVANPTLAELAVFASVFQRRASADPFLFTGEVPHFSPPPGVAFERTADGWMML